MPDPRLSVAPATLDDVPGVARVMREVADERRWIATPAGTPLDELEQRFERTVREAANRLLVLRADGQVVGNAALCAGRPRAPHDFGISIAPAWRGRGGGGLLTDAVLAHAQSDPAVAKVTLEVWTHNAAAVALYASRGFVVEGVLRDHYAAPSGEGRWSAIVMGWWPARP